MRSTTRGQRPYGTLAVDGDRVVYRMTGWAAVLALRGRISAPLPAVTSVRAIDPAEKLRLRLWGSSWSNFGAGLFWSPERGVCFVAKRRGREAVEITFAGRRIRQWIVEVESAVEAIDVVDRR